MIRGTGIWDNGKRVVFLGLEPENFRRMARNQPIKVNLADIHQDGVSGLPNIDVVIFDIQSTPPEDMKRLFQVDPDE